MIPLTRHGAREMLVGSVVLVLIGAGLGVTPLRWLAILLVPLLIFLFAFFRDPERAVPAEQHAIVSPADGKVSDITQIENDPLIGGPAVRVGIFLSVFNVHVNRTPCDGRVLAVTYKKGKFINAMNHAAASDDNESNTIVLAEAAGQSAEPIVAVKQIVGLIARRIICTAKPGDVLRRGSRFGMIKFGSRTELTISMRLNPTIKVRVGQTVRGAADVIAVVGQPIHTAAATPAKDEAEPLVGTDTPA